MSEVAIPKIALAGNPNCGKTALFNALTGGKQKVGNYPGVTVERKEGSTRTPSGLLVSVLDLPGTYSLDARTPDEAITANVLLGRQKEETPPEALIAVADATNLERCLGLVLELKALGRPVVLALNMMDLASERGCELDVEILSRELEVPVVPTVAVKRSGIPQLLQQIEELLKRNPARPRPATEWKQASSAEIHARFERVDGILARAVRQRARPTHWSDRIDRVVLHPVLGTLLLGALLAVMFQAIFTWASIPMDWIDAGMAWLGTAVGGLLDEGPLRSLLVDGVIAGVGSILVFLPQILLLFLFILLLEDSGYMARAAFLMDRLMGRVGLHGRAFIPLLSSFACAVPGIMATRTIENRRDRLTTILVAPLITCSARLPVYALLIGAFFSNDVVWGPIRLQGLVMFLLYLSGIVAALLVAVVIRRTVFRGPTPPLLMELPTYKWPSPRNIAHGLLERAGLFVRRAGTVILSICVVLWFLTTYPKPTAGQLAATPGTPPIAYSYAGQIGHALEPLVAPIGFNWKIAVALIPGFAAREVMVSALGTVYAVESGAEPAPQEAATMTAAAEGAAAPETVTEEGAQQALGQQLKNHWSVATAISLLVWYILAPQCLSTLAVTRRETNSWKWPMAMLGYLTALAYACSWLAYRAALAFGLG